MPRGNYHRTRYSTPNGILRAARKCGRTASTLWSIILRRVLLKVVGQILNSAQDGIETPTRPRDRQRSRSIGALCSDRPRAEIARPPLSGSRISEEALAPSSRAPLAPAPVPVVKTYWSRCIPMLRQLASGQWLPDTVPRTVRWQCLRLLEANPISISVVTAHLEPQRGHPPRDKSVLEQTYPVTEMIVVDDGSEDGTASAIRERFADAIAGGKLVLIERPHEGICATRNVALERARGDIIAYLDSDNCWHSDFTLYMGAVFAAAPHVATAYCGENIHNRDTGEDEQLLKPYDRAALLARSGIDLNTFVHRRELVKAAGGFDTSLTPRLVDWELILRYTQYCPPATVPIYLVEYFLDSEALHNVTFTENWERNWQKIVRRHLRERLRTGSSRCASAMLSGIGRRCRRLS